MVVETRFSVSSKLAGSPCREVPCSNVVDFYCFSSTALIAGDDEMMFQDKATPYCILGVA